MGVVYAAHDPVLDRKIALKILHDRMENQESEQRLLREAQAMARLNHPHVVAVHDAGTHEGRPFVAMEFVEGRSLDTWLKQARPPWKEVVAAFVAAGEGLEAAHLAGLVHRDFKPGNVLVGDDGRIRVTDFGLARSIEPRAWESTETIPSPPPSSMPPEISATPLDTPMTKDGWVVGTPAYMAPEHVTTGFADQLSDQFSFCVSLYRALFGRHPIGPISNLETYVARLQSFEAIQPPAGHSIPKRILSAILRGLSLSPADRFGTIGELLQELRFDPGKRRRRRMAWSAAAVAAIAAAGGLASFTAHRRQLCSGATERVAEVWNVERKTALESSFTDTAGPIGGRTAAAAAQLLDAYAGDWASVFGTACEATRIRGEQSEELLDRQMSCLTRRLREADHLLTLLEQGGSELVSSALDAVVGLQSPAVCGDLPTMVERVPLPTDPDLRSRIDDLESDLAAAEAERLAGDYQTCLDRLTRICRDAPDVEYPPLLAEALVAKGFIEAELSLSDDSEQSLRRGLAEAERGRDDTAAAMAASNLMWVTGFLQDHFDEAERWGQLADAKVARLDNDERLAANVADVRASVLVRAGRYSEARAVQERALELHVRLNGPESLDAAMAMTTMGHVLSSIGEYEAAIEHYQRSLELKERLVGPDHPTVASTAVSLAQAYGGIGDHERVVELSERALAIQERVFGSDDPKIAVALNNLAFGLEGLGRLDEARAVHQRSLDVVTNAWGPDHPQLAYTWLNLSSLEKRAGDYESALAASLRAGEIVTAAFGTDHPLYAYAANNIGVFLMLTGRAGEAIPHLEKALSIRSSGATDPVLLEVTRFNLGRALWQAGRRDQGRRLVRQAAAALETMGERGQEDLEAARGWLADR